MALRTRPGYATGDQLDEVRVPLDIDTLATGHGVARARREFAAWLSVDLPAGELFDDLVLAVHEALANVAEHAYAHTAAGTGPVELVARRSLEAVRITVSDRGRWHDAPSSSAVRGHGLRLVRLLIHDVHIERAATGTVVHLRTPLPVPAEPR